MSHKTQRGFTLLETLVVILIISVGLTLLLYGFSQGLEKHRDRRAKTDLVFALREVRNQAIVSSQTKTLQFDLSSNGYQIPGLPEHVLPKGMIMRVTTAAKLLPDGEAIAFYPDGSSSGGNIVLIKDNRSWRVDIAWLTGRVSWTDVEQP
ncbi:MULTISPECIES: GspH/FimT family pseudopilin [unclassified Pseudomonas]|uniref:GspH/FimT family pseudopilin n=1 Tax=unclassified Pseudomonas TaxID=196821 RepID=UPI002A366FCD|nr:MULTISPECIES: GspH/FimT family pseudopilin [unclassified Pseudomonas]MDX9669574.1 prepilin-type N-terminal cleavage/methylation domain-containing protein [Pseudomonas sp. P8_250]WPN36390.1 prepilin-type N-terminal cleavage/methylation domain-containing protein [Pseudomonas sp. P8_139]WPN41809.1 prepilin-type N-terminal cleavage/methylation domain-containing protein [Pseudomonas sp. P8_229]